jgi:hypothetical protein
MGFNALTYADYQEAMRAFGFRCYETRQIKLYRRWYEFWKPATRIINLRRIF